MSALTISRYFTLAARQAAASATYTTRSTGSAPGTFRRTKHGADPLGTLLQADGYGDGYRCPDSALAASAIYQRQTNGERVLQAEANERVRAIRNATAAFIQAWDAGEIASLVVALDVPANVPAPARKMPEFATIARKRQRMGAGWYRPNLPMKSGWRRERLGD